MNHDIDSVLKLFEGGEIRRFHGHPVHTHQTNTHHGARVALIAEYLDPDCAKALLVHCLIHDAAEIETGDIPSPAKRKHRELAIAASAVEQEFLTAHGVGELDLEEYRVLKIADWLETMLFCIEELRLGNRGMEEIYNNCEAKVRGACGVNNRGHISINGSEFRKKLNDLWWRWDND